MRIDQDVTVRAVNRVVEDRAVEADLYAVRLHEIPVVDERVTYLRGHGIAYAFSVATFRDLGAVRVAQEDAYGDSAPSPVGQRAKDPDVLSEEEASVDED